MDQQQFMYNSQAMSTNTQLQSQEFTAMKKIIESLGVKIDALELEAKISNTKLAEKDKMVKKYKDMLSNQSVTNRNYMSHVSKSSNRRPSVSGKTSPKHRFDFVSNLKQKSIELAKVKKNSIQT